MKGAERSYKKKFLSVLTGDMLKCLVIFKCVQLKHWHFGGALETKVMDLLIPLERSMQDL